MCNYSSQSLISGMYACVVSIYVPLYIEMEYNQYTLTLLSMKIRACLAQLQLLILNEDLEEPCQTDIFLNRFSCGAERSGVVFVKKGGI
jgi:hypothetical protein